MDLTVFEGMTTTHCLSFVAPHSRSPTASAGDRPGVGYLHLDFGGGTLHSQLGHGRRPARLQVSIHRYRASLDT